MMTTRYIFHGLHPYHLMNRTVDVVGDNESNRNDKMVAV